MQYFPILGSSRFHARVWCEVQPKHAKQLTIGSRHIHQETCRIADTHSKRSCKPDPELMIHGSVKHPWQTHGQDKSREYVLGPNNHGRLAAGASGVKFQESTRETVELPDAS